MAIVRSRNDIVIARKNERFLEAQQAAGMGFEAVHPGEFVGKSLRTRRISIGRIERHNTDDPARFTRYNGFQITGVVVAFHRRQTSRDVLGRAFRQDRNAVVALLSVHGAIVAQALERIGWEGIVRGLYFLQADDIGRGLGKPASDGVDPRFDRIDVPGGDLHAFISLSWPATAGHPHDEGNSFSAFPTKSSL